MYIASDSANRCVIGISNNMNHREKTYVIHNPSFKITSVYYCRDYKLIECIIKKLMAKYIHHERSNEWFNYNADKMKIIIELIIHLIDDDVEFDTFNDLHKMLNLNTSNIQHTNNNDYFGDGIYNNFINECCDISEDFSEGAKNLLTAFKDYVNNKNMDTSKIYNELNAKNNSYGFIQSFQSEFYKNINKIIRSELCEFRINGKTISGFKNIKLKTSDINLLETHIKNDFPDNVYSDYLNNWIVYNINNDKRGKIKIKTSDIIIHFTKYLQQKNIIHKNTLINDNVFRIKFVSLITLKFSTKELIISFNQGEARGRNKGFRGIELLN